MEDRARLDARELARAWQAILGRLELELNTHNMTAWFSPTRALSFDGAVLTLEARTAMASEYLDRRMRVVIERAATHVFGCPVSLALFAAGEAPDEPSTSTGSSAAPSAGCR